MSKPRIKKLAKEISSHNYAYYTLSKPEVSDQVYDAKHDELRKLCPHHPLVTGHGAEWSAKLKKVPHEVPMGSLNKVNLPEEFEEWANRDCKDHKKFLGTEKLDGLSVSLKYEKGKFVQGLTRGKDGIGEDITINVKLMQGVPASIDKNFTGHVRGEIVLFKSVLKQHFPDLKTARNGASGIARRLDADGVDKLNVICYKIEGEDFSTELESFERLDELGFDTPNYKVANTAGTIKMWNTYKDKTREKLDYEIDGLVFTVNDCAAQYAMGDKGRGPAGAMAFKFDPPGAITIIRDIIWQVGSTGRITPVAVFDEVDLLGAMTTRASLYNQAYIDELGIEIGAKVLVIKANDVIPRVEEVISSPGTAKSPKVCPECGGKVEQFGEYTVCTNKDECPPQLLGRVSTWIKELGVLEWGDKIIQKMFDAGIVSDVPDIYELTVDDICKLDKMGKRSAEVLLKELDKFREIPLYNLIGGLGIENVATSTTKKIMKAGYDSLDAMHDLTVSDIESISGFGYTKAVAFVEGLKDNKDRIQDILKSGVTIKAKVQGSLSGKSFCFTQSCPDYGRKELMKIVEDGGGEVEKSAKKGVSFLVLQAESKATSKVTAAKKNGVQILTYDKFLSMAGV